MDIAELQRLLKEATRRAEEAEQGRQQERERAEEAEQVLQQERERAKEAEELIRPTTLDEYIAATHTLVFSRLFTEPDPRLTSKGRIATPEKKYCPTNLEAWTEFLDLQRTIFGTLYDTFPLDSRVFENRNFLTGLGERVSKRPVADEKSLEYFLHISVEDSVRNIVEKLRDTPDVLNAFGLGNGIIFENHPHAISDVAQEVLEQEAAAAAASPPQTPGHGFNLNQLRPDQICIYRSDGGSLRTMLYISEYKPPHKLTAGHLRQGLRSMNMHQDVVSRKTIPTNDDPEGRLKYFADKLTASALTQTYHYMLHSGLEYSLLTTGKAIVFLKIDWEDPYTLYYHLAEPDPEVTAHPANMHLCTAVGQYLAFTLLALSQVGARRQHGQTERETVMRASKKWAADFELTHLSTSESDRRIASEGSLAPKPRTYELIDRSPLRNRLRPRPLTRPSCRDDCQRVEDHLDSSSDDESFAGPPDTPSPSVRRSDRLVQRPRGGGNTEGVGQGGGGTGAQYDYCTQNCLLGLISGEPLDPGCPNYKLHQHCRTTSGNHHPVTHTRWLTILYEQLQESLDDGIQKLQLSGSRGVLFKVTLLAYGYTFISKGTVKAFIKDLEHEAAVYERLRPIQGVRVPVFLGAIDLRPMGKVYYYDHRVYIVHMTFLSWGGYTLSSVEAEGVSMQSLRESAICSVRAIHRQGVQHNDVRAPNMLFNQELQGVILIDFERAKLLQMPRPALLHVSPDKRARDPEGSGKHLKKRLKKMLEEDVFMAEQIFLDGDT